VALSYQNEEPDSERWYH